MRSGWAHVKSPAIGHKPWCLVATRSVCVAASRVFDDNQWKANGRPWIVYDGNKLMHGCRCECPGPGLITSSHTQENIDGTPCWNIPCRYARSRVCRSRSPALSCSQWLMAPPARPFHIPCWGRARFSGNER